MRYLPCLLLISLITACGSQKESTLEWPQLKALDLEVEELDGLLTAEQPDPAVMAEHLPHVKEALDALLESGVPGNVAHPEMVHQKLEELSALADDIGSNSDVLPALHPLVASIMEVAGMPHVHDGDCCAHHSDKEKHPDHDHGNHDHAHGDEDHGDHDH